MIGVLSTCAHILPLLPLAADSDEAFCATVGSHVWPWEATKGDDKFMDKDVPVMREYALAGFSLLHMSHLI